jgi:hypothetical protein
MPTPTPPPFGEVYMLDSGAALLVLRTFSAGELFVGLVLLVLLGWLALTWVYGLAQQKN